MWFTRVSARNGGTNTGRREIQNEENESDTKSSYLRSLPYKGTRTPRGMFPSSIRPALVITSVCPFPSPSLFERVSEKRPNSCLTLRPKCRSGTKRDGTRMEGVEKGERRSETEEVTWRKEKGEKEGLGVLRGCIFGHISGRLFTRQWFQPRPDKNYSNGPTRCKFHMGIPSTSGAPSTIYLRALDYAIYATMRQRSLAKMR